MAYLNLYSATDAQIEQHIAELDAMITAAMSGPGCGGCRTSRYRSEKRKAEAMLEQRREQRLRAEAGQE